MTAALNVTAGENTTMGRGRKAKVKPPTRLERLEHLRDRIRSAQLLDDRPAAQTSAQSRGIHFAP